MSKAPFVIILIGSMGAGKTSTGKELAKHFNVEFLDTDHWIEEKNQRTIPEIFKEKGEGYFRAQEKEAIVWLKSHSSAIVSTGGGLWMDPANREELLLMGLCIWLKVSAEEAWKRVGHHVAQRPLLGDSEDPKVALSELLEKRSPFYAMSHAGFTTDGKSAKEVALEIESFIKKNEGHLGPYKVKE